MDIMEEMKKSSMLYWHPKIVDLDIPQPKTEMVRFKSGTELLSILDGDFSVLEPYMDEIKEKAGRIGFPLFMRTDHVSGKHDWKNTCYVTDEKHLGGHISFLVEESFTVDILGLPVNALFLREYIPMKQLFTAFWGDMPVNPEMRYFVRDGEIVCSHWYWIEEAIRNASIDDWKELISEERKGFSRQEAQQLHNYTKLVGEQFEGYWSVDFCKAENGRWILIDMAVGESSWHPKDCINYKE